VIDDCMRACGRDGVKRDETKRDETRRVIEGRTRLYSKGALPLRAQDRGRITCRYRPVLSYNGVRFGDLHLFRGTH